MDIYNYHPKTLEFLSVDDADKDPLDTERFLIPAFSTAVAPPKAGVNEIAVFNSGKWEIKDDYRGQTYWQADRTEHTITEIGEVPVSDALWAEPPLTQAEILAQEEARQEAEISSLITKNAAVARLLVSLINGLLAENVIQGGSFTAKEIQMYQKIKEKVEEFYG